MSWSGKDRKPWFGPKRSGAGLRPQTWQAWLIIVIIVAVLIVLRVMTTHR
jgi:hypothetical protein